MSAVPLATADLQSKLVTGRAIHDRVFARVPLDFDHEELPGAALSITFAAVWRNHNRTEPRSSSAAVEGR